MTTATTDMSLRTERFLRRAGWFAAAALLTLPAIAMQFTGEVNWTASDFIFAGVVFAIVGGLFELTARASTNLAFRIGAVAAVACGFLQIWINLAVGIIGNEDNSANWTYFAVVFMAAAGAITALGNPRSLVRAMLAAAGAQVLFSIVHAVNGTPTPFIDGFFTMLWLLAARLFHRAALQREASAT
ncbi:MAG: hypothetical protein ACK4NZ_14645 [Tsuneonella sp.]